MNFKKYLRVGNGGSDITPLLGDGDAFSEVVKNICNLFAGEEIEIVACIEGRGFLLGGAVAFNLGCGVIPVRYPGKLKNKTVSEKFVDYSGKEKELQIHKDGLVGGKKVLVVDDWVETGMTLRVAIRLIESIGGVVVGVGVFMDDSNFELKQWLAKYNYKFLERVTEKDKF